MFATATKKTKAKAKKTAPTPTPPDLLTTLCEQLHGLQRKREIVMKSHVMQANRLQAIIAGTLGYSSHLGEKERRVLFTEAGKVITAVLAGKAEHDLQDVIRSTQTGLDEFERLQGLCEKAMLGIVAQLPVAKDWLQHPEQRGFGELSLAKIVGECRNLSGYATPAKLWKRLGCAPHEFEGQRKMGSTWRYGKEGKLPAEEWEKYGYNPRRRAMMYVIGEGLLKQNFLGKGGTDGDGERVTEAGIAGPYRLRYLQAKVRAFTTHPEWTWTPCTICKNDKKKKKHCPTCGGTGMKCGRAHRHGMLVATKRLLRNLWCAWNKKPEINEL